ncbi:fatty acid--CoA ligase [Sphingobium amiense]|uniref:3-methylmercaptopropionyl-CoA ligase n=1 Tax=Sphingobium amiense TaxID=135719 RepID=A0A494W692_9SPHN|nr:fatty acid--CoA ligase [Sphingobium amiense]BBD99771.1 fatty acid--CoA ligase [Sphingobium amiense]
MAAERRTIGDYLRGHAQDRGDAVALAFEGESIDYATLDRRASRIANGLIAMGLTPGSRVAYLGKNRAAYFELWMGAIRAGMVMTPVNWRLAPPEIAYVLADCRPALLVADPDFADRLDPAPSCPVLLTEAGGAGDLFAAWRDAQADADPRRDSGYGDPALMLYTSGTTGQPKGAMLTHRSLLGLRDGGGQDDLPAWFRWSPHDVALVAMPIFHISGSGWGLWALQHGAKAVVVREFDPHQVLDLLVEHRITKLMIVPTALRIVCDHPRAAQTDFSFLETICYGGSMIPLDLLRQAIGIFGCGFAQMYGMTETAGTVAGLAPEDHDVRGNERMASIGRALPGVEIRILDPQGHVLPPGEVGEVAIRSPSNMAGYHGRPEATAQAMDADGWLRTGDAARMDADGYVYLADRIKDMIITGGENVYPAEVEQAILGHPDVADVAVIGVPDPKWGEAVKAIVVPVEGATPDPAAIIAWARERIAAYKAPKSVDFAPALPRNPSGKVLRRLLRDQYR